MRTQNAPNCEGRETTRRWLAVFVRRGVVRGVVRFGCDVVWCGVVQRGVVWCGMRQAEGKVGQADLEEGERRRRVYSGDQKEGGGCRKNIRQSVWGRGRAPHA